MIDAQSKWQTLFPPLSRWNFYAWMNCEMRTDNISGSWGFNWNWYVCYSNSEIPRSKGICCSSCHHYSTSSHGTNSLSSHVFDHFLQPETRKNFLFVRIFEQVCASITRLKTLLLGWRKQEGKVYSMYPNNNFN